MWVPWQWLISCDNVDGADHYQDKFQDVSRVSEYDRNRLYFTWKNAFYICLFYAYVCFDRIHICQENMHSVQKKVLYHWNNSYGSLGVTTWMLRTKPTYTARTKMLLITEPSLQLDSCPFLVDIFKTYFKLIYKIMNFIMKIYTYIHKHILIHIYIIEIHVMYVYIYYTHSYFVLHTHKPTSVTAILPNYCFPNSTKTSELKVLLNDGWIGSNEKPRLQHRAEHW